MEGLDLLTADVEEVEQPGAEIEDADGSDEQPEGEETPEGGEKPEETTDDQPKTPVTSLFQPDGKKLDPQVSATLQKIKGEHPELGKLLTKAVFRAAELDREFPGGLTEARELRDKVEELGGVEQIEAKIETATEYEGLAKQFMDGDPAFVEDMVASSPESFAKLAPLVFQRWAGLDKGGFSSAVARVIFSDMHANQLPLMMMRLGDLVGDNPKAKEAFEAINAYLGGLQQLAAKPAPEFKPQQRQTAKNDDTAKREEDLRAREWKSDQQALERKVITSEFTRCLAGRKPSDEDKAAIMELLGTRAKTAAERLFPKWQEKAKRYIANNDKSGYLRYRESIYRRIIPETMPSAVNAIMKGRKAPVPGGQPKPKPGTAGGQPRPPADGFKPVAKEPGSFDIDYGRTTTAMLARNQAVLHDGSKVQWK